MQINQNISKKKFTLHLFRALDSIFLIKELNQVIMILKAKQRLLFLRSLKDLQDEEGFTLIELIVVVMLIGILSSIAIPSFLSINEKARQSEAATLVSSYLKATESYFTEYGAIAKNAGHLDEYVSLVACSHPKTNIKNCKDNVGMRVYGNTTEWHSPSAHHHIRIRFDTAKTHIIADPVHVSKYCYLLESGCSNRGLGVAGCFNTQTGISKVHLSKAKGKVSQVNC